MLYSTVAIDPSNIDSIKGYNTLSYPKLHVEFEYNNPPRANTYVGDSMSIEDIVPLMWVLIFVCIVYDLA